MWSSSLFAKKSIDGLQGVSTVVPVNGTQLQIDSGYLNEQAFNSFLKGYYTEIEGVQAPNRAKTDAQRQQRKDSIKRRRSLLVEVHVPKELPRRDKIAFVESIEKKFSKWQRVKIRVQEISVESMKTKATEQNRLLREAEGTLPKGSVHPRLRKTLEGENNKMPSRAKRWLTGWQTNTMYQVARIFPIGLAFGSAVLVVSKIGFQTPLAVATTLAIGAIEFASQYSTNRWNVEFNNWKENYTLPFGDRIRTISWFNNRHLLKASLFNFFVFSTTKPTLYRYFMNVANPAVEGLTAEFFGQLATAGAGGAIFGVLGHKGFTELVESGYISANVRRYLVWGLAIQGVAGAGFIAAGYSTLVPYMLAFNWGVNGLIFLAGKVLPPRAARASVYHGTLAALGLDVRLKGHNEEKEALKRQDYKEWVAKNRTIEIEGKSLKEIADIAAAERTKQPITQRLRNTIKDSFLKIFPSLRTKPNCSAIEATTPPFL